MDKYKDEILQVYQSLQKMRINLRQTGRVTFFSLIKLFEVRALSNNSLEMWVVEIRDNSRNEIFMDVP